MVWDFGKAMQKKEEFESARLMDFEFRQRARAIRLLLARLGVEDAVLARDLAAETDAALIDRVVLVSSRSRAEVEAGYRACLGEARRRLIAERGDPSPVRLG